METVVLNDGTLYNDAALLGWVVMIATTRWVGYVRPNRYSIKINVDPFVVYAVERRTTTLHAPSPRSERPTATFTTRYNARVRPIRYSAAIDVYPFLVYPTARPTTTTNAPSLRSPLS